MSTPNHRHRRSASSGREPIRPSRDRSADGLISQCRVDTFRSGGKGGQHQNKVESGVRLTHLPTGITATSRKHRSQRHNLRAAVARLREKIDELERIPKVRQRTRVPMKERLRRLKDKAQRSRIKRLRKRPGINEP